MEYNKVVSELSDVVVWEPKALFHVGHKARREKINYFAAIFLWAQWLENIWREREVKI